MVSWWEMESKYNVTSLERRGSMLKINEELATLDEQAVKEELALLTAALDR